MQTKNLIVLALVGVVVLTGALIVATARKGEKAEPMVTTTMPRKTQSNVIYPPAEGTLTGSAAQASVEVIADNVQTSVQVQ